MKKCYIIQGLVFVLMGCNVYADPLDEVAQAFEMIKDAVKVSTKTIEQQIQDAVDRSDAEDLFDQANDNQRKIWYDKHLKDLIKSGLKDNAFNVNMTVEYSPLNPKNALMLISTYSLPALTILGQDFDNFKELLNKGIDINGIAWKEQRAYVDSGQAINSIMELPLFIYASSVPVFYNALLDTNKVNLLMPQTVHGNSTSRQSFENKITLFSLLLDIMKDENRSLVLGELGILINLLNIYNSMHGKKLSKNTIISETKIVDEKNNKVITEEKLTINDYLKSFKDSDLRQEIEKYLQ